MPSPFDAFHTVICTDLSPGVNWQSELLEYSWSRINQPGRLVRLVSCDELEPLPKHRHMEVLRCQPTSVHPGSGDRYPPYNRLYSLQEWLRNSDINGSVLIIDPDVVFLKPLKRLAEPGRPIAQDWLDFGVSDAFAESIRAHSDVAIEQPASWTSGLSRGFIRRSCPGRTSRWVIVPWSTIARRCGAMMDRNSGTSSATGHGAALPMPSGRNCAIAGNC